MLGAFFCSINVAECINVCGESNIEKLWNGEKLSFIQTDQFYYEVLQDIYNIDELLKEGVENVDDAINSDEYYDDDYRLHDLKTLKYYIVDTKTKKHITNFDEDDDYKTILKDKKYAFRLVNNKYSQTDDMLDRFVDIGLYDENHNGYFYIDLDTENEDILSKIISSADYLNSFNFRGYVILAVLLLLLSIALAVFACVVCGKKKDNGKVKLLFLDYIPLDIHLIVSGALIALLCFAFAILVENFDDLSEYIKLIILCMSACGSAAWLILIEYVTSFIRVCKSDRKFYKNSIVILIIYALFKLTKLEIKGLKKLHKKNKENFKAVFGYKIQNFKKRLIFYFILYLIVNLLFFAFAIIWTILAYESGFAVFLLILDGILFLALNISAVIFISRYSFNLDKIITAAHNRTVPQVDYNKLPQSLKILVNSLQYSRTELNNAINKAVKDEHMRTELITNVSHDLKTPLTSIINYVDLLKGCDINDSNAMEYINVLDEKGSKLKRLIDDLIEASKATSGVITLNPVILSLNELATQAIVEHQQEFADNNLELILKGDKQNINAFADGNKTFRVIENLLSNARKYSAKGSRVYADIYETGQFSIFEIKNISAEPLDISPEELTERFVRGDKARTNEGNGLGLSIADNLCKAMNGRLEITIDGDLFKAKVILPKR
ncbi:MAG: sensor histidine kinase [Eubacterium sp.]